MMNARASSSLVAKATTMTTTATNISGGSSAWANLGRNRGLSSIASRNKSGGLNQKQQQPMRTVHANSDEVERVLERAKQMEAKKRESPKKSATRRLPKIETKPIDVPTRGRKWTDEPSVPDRAANDDDENDRPSDAPTVKGEKREDEQRKGSPCVWERVPLSGVPGVRKRRV